MKTTDRHMLAVVFGITDRAIRGSVALWSLALLVLGGVFVTAYGRVGAMPLATCPRTGAPIDMDVWLSTEFFAWLPLVTGLWAIVTISRLVAGRLGDRSMELLLAGPVHPRIMLWGRYLPVVTGLLIIHTSALLGIVVGFLFRSSVPPYLAYLAVLVHSLVLAAVLGALALLISVLTGRLSSAMGYGLGVLVATFVFDTAVRTAGGPDAWRMLTPFGYYTSCQIMAGAGQFSFNLIYLAGWLALLLTSSLHIFATRDLV